MERDGDQFSHQRSLGGLSRGGGGRWEAPERGHCENESRFSLTLTLETNGTDIDLYNAVRTELEIPICNELMAFMWDQ